MTLGGSLKNKPPDLCIVSPFHSNNKKNNHSPIALSKLHLLPTCFIVVTCSCRDSKKTGLKISLGQSEAVNQRTEFNDQKTTNNGPLNTMYKER